MNQIAGLIALAAASALAGCASQSANRATVAPAASTASQADPTFKPPSDFRRMVVDGREQFCRKYYPIGTRTESQTECLTEEELKQRQDSSRHDLDEAKRAWSTSSNPGGGLGHTAFDA